MWHDPWSRHDIWCRRCGQCRSKCHFLWCHSAKLILFVISRNSSSAPSRLTTIAPLLSMSSQIHISTTLASVSTSSTSSPNTRNHTHFVKKIAIPLHSLSWSVQMARAGFSTHQSPSRWTCGLVAIMPYVKRCWLVSMIFFRSNDLAPQSYYQGQARWEGCSPW